mmetsp:Transcript_30853/g.45223  ORF Transcript_30853/g.45223 Transcript_30853/m.45223 type:complete len:90 (-) Transcript_30853:181-450(-)
MADILASRRCHCSNTISTIGKEMSTIVALVRCSHCRPICLNFLHVYAYFSYSVDLYPEVHIADVPMAGTRHTINGIFTESKRKDDQDAS